MTSCQSITHFIRDTKLAHSLFTAPFIVITLTLVPGPAVSPQTLILIALAFLTARTYALGINRYLDRHIDAANPRTQTRTLPAGLLTPPQALSFTCAAGGSFIVIAGIIAPWLSLLAALVVALFTAYPFGKRLHWAVHGYLGCCLGLLPLAIPLAMAAPITPAVVLISMALTLWITGFDLLYALADTTFDTAAGLASFPARFGSRCTIRASSCCFSAMILLLAWLGVHENMGGFYAWGILGLASWLTWLLILASRSRFNDIPLYNAWVGMIYASIFFGDRWLEATWL